MYASYSGSAAPPGVSLDVWCERGYPQTGSNAFLSAEDKNFYSHHGIDLISMASAGQEREGGDQRNETTHSLGSLRIKEIDK